MKQAAAGTAGFFWDAFEAASAQAWVSTRARLPAARRADEDETFRRLGDAKRRT